MNTQTRIDRITEELRDIYQKTNEGPRLIAEMVAQEFPKSAEEICQPELEHLIGQVEGLRRVCDDLRDDLKEAEERISKANDALMNQDMDD